MDITYTWEITNVKVKDVGDNKNVIHQVYWKKIGRTRYGDTGVFVGATPIDTSSVDPDNFVDFDKIKENDIIKWIENIVVGDYEKTVNEDIESQILNNFQEQQLIKLDLSSSNTSGK